MNSKDPLKKDEDYSRAIFNFWCEVQGSFLLCLIGITFFTSPTSLPVLSVTLKVFLVDLGLAHDRGSPNHFFTSNKRGQVIFFI